MLSVTDNGTWYEFNVVPIDSGPGGAPTVGSPCGANFTVPVVGSTSYVSIAGYYASNTSIDGIIALDGGTPVTDDAAYGVDLEFTELITSPDWDIAAISAGGALGGTPGDGGGGGAGVWVSDNVPVDAVVNDLWMKTSDPVGLYVLYDDGDSIQWMQTNGATISGDFVSKAGDVMTGNLTVPDAVAVGHAPNLGQVQQEIIDAGSSVDIVEASVGVSSGWQVWGDTLIQWGLSQDASGTTNAVFFQPFKALPVVTGTCQTSRPDWRNCSTLNTSLTGFDLIVYDIPTNTPSNTSVLWIAVGEAPDALKKAKTVTEVSGGGGAGSQSIKDQIEELVARIEQLENGTE